MSTIVHTIMQEENMAKNNRIQLNKATHMKLLQHNLLLLLHLDMKSVDLTDQLRINNAIEKKTHHKR